MYDVTISPSIWLWQLSSLFAVIPDQEVPSRTSFGVIFCERVVVNDDLQKQYTSMAGFGLNGDKICFSIEEGGLPRIVTRIAMWLNAMLSHIAILKSSPWSHLGPRECRLEKHEQSNLMDGLDDLYAWGWPQNKKNYCMKGESRRTAWTVGSGWTGVPCWIENIISNWHCV